MATPTPLVTLSQVQTALGTTDPSQTTLFQSLIQQATTAILSWCHRKDFLLARYTRLLSGNNTSTLIVPDIPIQGVTLTGNTTSNSAVITGLSVDPSVFPNANNLFLYQSIIGTGIPQGAFISDVSSLSSGQVSISMLNNGSAVPALATATGTGVSLGFGIALWRDDNALGGTAEPFAVSSLLAEGVDYYIDWNDSPGGTCDSGIIYNCGAYWYRPSQWMYGLVSPVPGIPIKNVKIQMNAGYTAIPYDVQEAALLWIARARSVRKFGAGVQSLSNDMSVSLAQGGKLDVGLFTPEIRSLLANYLNHQIPSA